MGIPGPLLLAAAFAAQEGALVEVGLRPGVPGRPAEVTAPGRRAHQDQGYGDWATGARVLVERTAALEAAHRMRESGAPHLGEARVDVRRGRVRVELDVAVDHER